MVAAPKDEVVGAGEDAGAVVVRNIALLLPGNSKGGHKWMVRCRTLEGAVVEKPLEACCLHQDSAVDGSGTASSRVAQGNPNLLVYRGGGHHRHYDGRRRTWARNDGSAHRHFLLTAIQGRFFFGAEPQRKENILVLHQHDSSRRTCHGQLARGVHQSCGQQ